ncbi:MAG: hypothetical protein K6G10_07895 [Butyrivibrio sp.]|nr:hypothetical protein [Butyrivibrio sp.]
MGFFDMSTGGNMGFASVKNTRNFTDMDLYNMLSDINVTFGKPIMGDINGTPAVMYKNVTPSFDVFCRVHKSNVIMGKIGADGVSSATTALNMGVDMFLGHKDEGASKADRAVDELLGVIKKLENGEAVSESEGTSAINTSTGEEIRMYMQQKAISLKPKFDIFDQNKVTLYHVEGDLARLNYSIQKNGVEVLKLKKKLIALLPEYTIEKNKVTIAKIKKKFKLTKPELNGTVYDKELKIGGDILGFDYNLSLGGKEIAHVDTDRTVWSDCYRITILDEGYQDVIAALAIICDMAQDKENSNS